MQRYRPYLVNSSFFLSNTALLSLGAILSGALPAQAACLFSPLAGDDTFICDSGSSVGSLTDLGGNNTLILPVNGTGIINGDVTFGVGDDRIEVHSGTITGSVDQGGGADVFVISGGSVAGNVQQGSGIDDFQMTGGEIGSLNQGDGLDTFFMSDGRIVDAFDDGDHAVMTGGRIGRVNMKLDDNYFDMSGGTIDRNLVTGFGNDTIILSNGTIGGNINVSGGTDSITITGGSVGGNILLSFGDDQFTWNGGGVVYGNIDLGGDNDRATLANLTDIHIGATQQITGGNGMDSLAFDNVETGKIARFDSWETINLTNNTRLNFDTVLKLGDASTNTGTLSIDASSTIYGGAAQSGIAAASAGSLANVINSGRIDLTSGGTNTSDTFTITGNYTGQNGLFVLDTVLDADASPSDKLIIDSGTASGNTGIAVNNVGGSGAATASDGIMVVQSLNGATTAGGAFSLNGRAVAGAYEYFLFKGGLSDATGENWYLRSTLHSGTEPAPSSSGEPPIVGSTTPPSSGATRVEGKAVPLYRVEVPVYSALPPVAHHLALSTLGTFHERRGEQELLKSGGYLPANWARIFGQDTDMKWKGTVAPGFDGSLFGLQAGQDLFGRETASGHSDRFGLFFGYARSKGDVTGQALGWNRLAVGNLEVTGTSFGGYWTHIGPEGWYLDAVLMGTWFGGDAASNQGQNIDVDGHGVTASLEGGYPVALGGSWTLEPQAQLIWRDLSLDDQADRYSSVSFDADSAWTGRIGIRLQGTEETSLGKLRPYFKANLWRNFSTDQTVRLAIDPIVTELEGTSLEVGGGFTVDLTDKASLFATADYTTNLGGERSRIWEGNIGLNVKW